MKITYRKIAVLFLLITQAISLFVIYQLNKIENHISLPGFYYSDLGYDYISVSGTLVSSDGGGIGSPLNTNEFTCIKRSEQCKLVQAELFDGNHLSAYEETFELLSWDDNFIVFQTQPDSLQCVVWTYRIDRVRKELIGVRERAENYDYDFCQGIGLEKFEVKLIDGYKVLHD